ncbi:MAG: DUF1576 domain-containing protein [Spirochaetes bacterium]|nr:MAG: DUF1576 domain-containing protein [Spirochaetota bacterium]
MERQNKFLLVLLIIIMLSFIVLGLITDGPGGALKGFIQIQVHSGRLISDFIPIGGIGGTLINASLAGAVGLFIIVILKVQLSGPTYAAIFTIMGFGFFGKTPLNILPILFGVYLSSKVAGKMFREYIIIALFGTALGPLVSFMVFEFGFTGVTAVAAGILAGTITGFLLPAIAVSMLHLHQGYNLYNMGLSCGFFALFAASLVRAAGHQFESTMVWYSGESPVVIWLVPVLSIGLIIIGLVSEKMKSIKEFINIQKIPGRLPSDFMDMASLGGALINSGLIGIAGSIYIFLVRGDFNGAMIAGLLTIMGFGAFGTHLKNSWSIVLGVVMSTLLFGWELSSPGPLLAALFGTTLAPLAGQFGILTGIIAGFIHLIMVMQTGAWQGGMNLYNNGFAGGLTAAIIVAVIQWYSSSKEDFS